MKSRISWYELVTFIQLVDSLLTGRKGRYLHTIKQFASILCKGTRLIRN